MHQYGGTITKKQIRNYWDNDVWAKYKAVRALHVHTGGGDGDEDSEEEDDAPGSSGDEVGEHDEEEDVAEAGQDEISGVAVDGTSWQHVFRCGSHACQGSSFADFDLSDETLQRKTIKFSRSVLRRFIESEHYKIIDKVCVPKVCA